MEVTEIKALKKRAEGVVRALYELGKRDGYRHIRHGASASHFFSRDDRFPSIGVKQERGGFYIYVGAGAMYNGGDFISYLVPKLDDKKEKPVFDAKNPERVFTAFADLEANIKTALKMNIKKEKAWVKAIIEERQAEKNKREEQRLAKFREWTSEYQDEIAQIFKSVDQIEKLCNVRAMIEDASRHQNVEAKNRTTLIPDNAGVIGITQEKIIYCRQVRPHFGLSFKGVRLVLDRETKSIIGGEGTHIPEVIRILKEAEKDPMAAAKKAGVCTFCFIPLTDDESRRRGYGPNCAASYRLPWGADK